MQAQTSSNSVLSNPDIPSSKWLNRGITVGIILLLSGLAMAIYTLYVDALNPHYYHIREYHYYYQSNKVEHRGIEWYFWAPLIVVGLFATLLFADDKDQKNRYWFKEVLEGTIIDEYDSTNGFGARFYYFKIEGKNRAGEIIKVQREVGQKQYFDYDVGDEISFSKK